MNKELDRCEKSSPNAAAAPSASSNGLCVHVSTKAQYPLVDRVRASLVLHVCHEQLVRTLQTIHLRVRRLQRRVQVRRPLQTHHTQLQVCMLLFFLNCCLQHFR